MINQIDLTEEIYTLKEVAKILNVTWQTVRNYIKKGELEAIKLNKERDYRIPIESLNLFIKNKAFDLNIELKNSTKGFLNYEGKKTIKEIFNLIPKIELEEIENNNSQNLIIQGDNLLILKKLLETHKEKIDLIYIDPPFGTNQDFITYDGITAYSDKIKDEIFIEFIRERLYLLKELLSEEGSIYLHIDKKMGHYIKIIMDEVFGSENYINEITRIKCNPKNFARKAYGNVTDVIFFYSKNVGKNIWNEIKEPLTKEEIEKGFPKIDENGRRYTTNPLHAPGLTKDGATGQPWRGMLPPAGRHWRYAPNILTELDNNGLIEWSSSGNPRKKVFADEHTGKKIQDLWEMKDKGNTHTIYPTEKNHDLLELIIRNSSKENSIVLDCFSGSFSTSFIAGKLNRNFIGIDVSNHSIKVGKNRLLQNKINFNFYKIKE